MNPPTPRPLRTIAPARPSVQSQPSIPPAVVVGAVQIAAALAEHRARRRTDRAAFGAAWRAMMWL